MGEPKWQLRARGNTAYLGHFSHKNGCYDKQFGCYGKNLSHYKSQMVIRYENAFCNQLPTHLR